MTYRPSSVKSIGMTAKAKLRRSYIRASRHHTAAMQRELLLAAGYPKDKIYVEGHVGIIELLRAITDREYQIGVTTLGRLGRTREILREVLTEIITKGSTIHEVTTGREISTKREATAAAMAFDASRELTGDARGPTREEARERGKLGGKARGVALAERIAAERMPIGKAEKIWLNTKSKMTNIERLMLMPGWTIDAAYEHLGKRGAAYGRPRKDET